MSSGIVSEGTTKIKTIVTKSSSDLTIDDLVTSSNQTVVGDVKTGEQARIDTISGGSITRVKKIVVGTPIRRVNPGAAGSIDTLSGVDTSGVEDGSVLVYHDDSGNWEAQLDLRKQVIDGESY